MACILEEFSWLCLNIKLMHLVQIIITTDEALFKCHKMKETRRVVNNSNKNLEVGIQIEQ